MEDRDELIDILQRIKATVFRVQTKFSEADDLANCKRASDITEMPGGREIVNYINRQKAEESLPEYDRLIKDGDYLKNIITEAQAKFVYAVRIVSKKSDSDLTEEQTIKTQCEINQATIDIITYKDFLRRLYEAINIFR